MGGATRSFTAPFGGDAVLYIYDSSLVAPPAAVTDLRALRSGSDVLLRWTHAGPAAHHYEVWRGGDPYFALAAGAPGVTRLPDVLPASGATVEALDAGRLGNPDAHHFYMVFAVSATGVRSGPSGRVGEFEYPLQ